jgi:hypothetical protein
MTSFIAAVPPLTNPIPTSAWKTVQDSDGIPDFAAARKAPHHAVIMISVVTRAFTSTE